MSPVPPFDIDATGSAVYLYTAVADHIEARIAAGELPEGARLPSEPELHEAYGVSLGTARSALKELRRRGLVITLRAKGSFVKRSLEQSR
ncbi:winged helix-turn-helix transcriptional regulator [Streptosporangiaceae bacterium NEAU-GS5]|nr:winged helix-turn-helix transcriptional regulator [Streptosporangiaceae bacterium NEAU-GS5]